MITGRLQGVNMRKKPAANQIRGRRESLGVTSEELAKAIPISESHLSMIETGQRTGTMEVWEGIAKALQTTIDELRRLPTEDVEINLKSSPRPKFLLPVVTCVRAGTADEVLEDMANPLGYEWTSEEPRDDCDILEVCGDSMEPDFSTGDRIVVKRGEIARNGDVVVAEYVPDDTASERRLTLKVYLKNGGSAVLAPINRTRYDAIVMNRRWTIKGVMIKHIRRDVRGRYAGLAEDVFRHDGNE